jgi:hypothetical protein
MSRKVVYLLLAALFLLHQDFWLWSDKSLVLGLLPAGLAYHILYSLLSAAVWYLAIQHAWPEESETFASTESEPHP